MKRAKGRGRQKPKKPTTEVLAQACSVLDEMAKSDAPVNVPITFNHLFLHFNCTIDKGQIPGWYELSLQDVDIGVAPKMCDLIMFHPDGGLLLGRKDVAVLIDEEELGTEELLATYPDTSNLSH